MEYALAELIAGCHRRAGKGVGRRARAHPLALGETRKVVENSAWTVGIVESNRDAAEVIAAADDWAPTPEDGEHFVLGKVSVAVDGDALDAQGIDVGSEGSIDGGLWRISNLNNDAVWALGS